MRYGKGIMVVSADRDIPTLLQVRNSRFISHDQLFEFMKSRGYEYSRRSFNWRTKRHLDAGLIAACKGKLSSSATVYHITTEGLLYLEDHGEFATVLNSATGHLPDPVQLHHALGLNSIHLALLHSGVLASWSSDIETASRNTISAAPLGKDYDAIVDVWNNKILARFALEYERTLKSSRQYEKIRGALKTDTRIGCVLYLASGSEIVVHLARELSGTPKRVAFATAGVFQQHLLETPVLTDPKKPVTVFRELLLGVF
jgi:hypothetical protein